MKRHLTPWILASLLAAVFLLTWGTILASSNSTSDGLTPVTDFLSESPSLPGPASSSQPLTVETIKTGAAGSDQDVAPQPAGLVIAKTANPTSASFSDPVEFTIRVGSTMADPMPVFVLDPIPDGTQYVPDSYTSNISGTREGYDASTNTIVWQGELKSETPLEIRFKVQVVRCEPEGFQVRNVATAYARDQVRMPVAATTTVDIARCPGQDLGDAPDSSNHSLLPVMMSAYPGVPARFPTVFDPATGAPPGPLHWMPRADAWLGRWVSGEHDADLMPDEDGLTNIEPRSDSSNRDKFDDGLAPTTAASFRHCQRAEIQVQVNVAPLPTTDPASVLRKRYINVWFDWNRDGDWEDAFNCDTANLAVLEWAVRDFVVTLPPGLHVVTLPAFLAFNPTPEHDLWVRITLSDQPAPHHPDSNLADGRGPREGYKYGETEDYLIPGRPPLEIHKVVDKPQAIPGDALEYTITLSNSGQAEIAGVHMEDAIPPGTTYISGTLQASKPTANYANRVVTWDGDVAAGETVTVSFKVEVGAPNVVEPALAVGCERIIRNFASLTLPNGVSYASNTVPTNILCPDLGDAPDSTNHFSVEMKAYPGVLAKFPTVLDPATGLPPGPAHWMPRADAWLGRWVSGERDADRLPDEDGLTNLDPRANISDRDKADDGLVQPVTLPHCRRTEIQVLVNVAGPIPTPAHIAVPIRQRFVNVWFDWNRDGDWEDAFNCEGQDLLGTLEWAVRNYEVALPPGLHVVTLPAFLAYNPTPEQPLWARITLSEQQAPLNPVTHLADGRGPDGGYKFGETEDYLIPGRPPQSELKVHKTVDKLSASPGDTLAYTIVMYNGGSAEATGVRMEDVVPTATTYIDGSLWASKPTEKYVDGVVTWEGNIAPGEAVTISFKVGVNDKTTDAVRRCEGRIRNYAVLKVPDAPSLIPSNDVYTQVLCPDLGDAPDSSNHFGAVMTTYPATVTANFPTVYDPMTGVPQGPIHRHPTQDAWLGPRVSPPSGERDADLMPDEDGRPNIEPPANKADQDRHDDGVFLDRLDLKHCEPTTLTYQVTVVGPRRDRFVNVWFDWNRDGDWNDVLQCSDNDVAPEWAVQNQVISLGPGSYVLTTTKFLPYHPDSTRPDDPLWMRITLAERPFGTTAAVQPAGGSNLASPVPPAGGSGPAAGYEYGETEDYYLGHIITPEPPDIWVTKELRPIDLDVTPVDVARPVPARFHFLIQYGNQGGSTAADVVIADTLPVSTTYRGSRSLPDIEPPTLITPTVSWQAGALNPGAGGVIDLWFHIPADLFLVLPPGTVMTNTVTISTTTPGDDPSNNTGVVTATIPLLPPRITWPIPGTTCTGTFTVTGQSQIGTAVDLYVDGVFTATATLDAQGKWSVPLTLPDGSHGIYAVARTAAGNVSDPSPTVVIIVDSSLTWDPLSLTFSTVMPGGKVWVQHIRTADGRADPEGWRVFLPTRPGETQMYTVTVHTCCQSTTGVTLTVGITDYALSAAGDGWYQAVIPAPGVPNVPMTLTVACGEVTSSSNGSGLIDPDGYVFDVDMGKAGGKLADQTVTLVEFEAQTQSWDRWPAEMYESQVNPQVTGDDGYYSFYTPPGNYQIAVDASPGYQNYRSWTLAVISTPVHLDVPLTKAYAETDYAVSVDASGFVPAALQVVQGSVVRWTNNEASDGVWHSTTSDVDARAVTSGWDSGLLNRGESYSRRFDTLGTFTYSDHENPSLVGTIKVCYLYDFDCDDDVEVNDLMLIANRWGAVGGQGNGYDARYDVDGDSRISIADIQKTAVEWMWTAP